MDWRSNTRLKHCGPDTQVVVWFWQIVEGYSEEMRARLLQFVTGSSRVPLQVGERERQFEQSNLYYSILFFSTSLMYSFPIYSIHF